MGAEEFRVRITTGRAVEETRTALLALPHMRRHAQWDAALVYEDERYILDLDLTRGTNATSVKVGFALCQESSIDHFYADFVLRVAQLLSATSVFVEGLRAGIPLRPHWDDLTQTICSEILPERELWIAQFGSDTSKLGCEDAMRVYAMGLKPGRDQ